MTAVMLAAGLALPTPALSDALHDEIMQRVIDPCYAEMERTSGLIMEGITLEMAVEFVKSATSIQVYVMREGVRGPIQSERNQASAWRRTNSPSWFASTL